MSWPRLALVATPDVGAAVLYEFNLSRNVKVAHQGFDLGAPEWHGEPGVSGGILDYRTISFTHWVDGGDAAAVTELATLGQLLTADYGWLLIQQRAAAAPTWLKVWRSSPGGLSWDDVRVDSAVQGRYGITLSFTAESLLVGESVTLANAVTVNNDPAAGTNPNRIVLSTVLGDAPAPALVTVTPNTIQDGALRLLAITPGSALPPVWQVGTSDGWSVVNFAAATADADWSAGSYRQSTASPASVSTTKTVQPGRYMVYVRAGAPVGATGVWEFYFDGPLVNLRVKSEPFEVINTTTDGAHWHPVGVVTIPQGSILPDDVLVSEPTITVSVAVGATRLSGTGNVNFDAIALLPMSKDVTSLRWMIATETSVITADTVDAERELIYSRDTSTSVLLSRPALAKGGFPVLLPGSNVLHLYGALAGASAEGVAMGTAVPNRRDLITTTHTVTVTYRPRWLWPRP